MNFNKRKRVSSLSAPELERKKMCYPNCNTTSHDIRCHSATNDPTTSSSCLDRENGKHPQAKPYILMENEVKNDDELYLEDQHIDKILDGLVKTTGKRHRVGFITLLFSELIKKHDSDTPALNTLQYIQPSAAEVSILLVPIHSARHYTLAVFDLVKKVSWHFDTLMSSRRRKAAMLYEKIKAALERDLKMEFKPMSKADCQKLINEQVDFYNCGVHVCRIAEEIFFYGFSRRLFPFVIADERMRIRDIYNAICDPAWNGEWFPQLQAAPSSNDDGRSTPCNGAPSTSTAAVLEDIADTTINQNDRASVGSPDSMDGQSAIITHEYFEYLIANLPQISIEIHTVIPSFSQLSVLRTCYQYLERFRKKEYNRKSSTMKTITAFDMDLFEKLKKNELLFIHNLINGFQSYFELPVDQKIVLFENFYPTFIIFERAFDTVNFVKSKCDGKGVLLQNDCYLNVDRMEILRLDGMGVDVDVQELKKCHWIPAATEKLLPAVMDLALHPIEAMYAFGVILMDIAPIQASLSAEAIKAKQVCFDRIHADLFQFYGTNEEKFKKIADIQDAVNCAKEIATNYMKDFKKLMNNNGNNGFFVEETASGTVAASSCGSGTATPSSTKK